MLDHFPATKRFLKRAYSTLLEIEVRLKNLYWKICWGRYPSPQDIPIIINNYNRYEMLIQLIDSLESRGYHNIIILDNASSYPPLLDYYHKTDHKVIHLGGNIGYLALWKAPGVYKQFKKSFYVYTDPDVVLDNACPADFMSVFLQTLIKYPSCQKIGFGIRIDNLPDHYKDKLSVLQWEKQHWEHPYGDNLYKARIDTTFALYRPFCKGGHSAHLVFRTGFPYVIRHLPWYQDSEHLSSEDSYYISHANQSTMWTSKNK